MNAVDKKGESKHGSQIIYALVSNIPVDYHTPDLRNFFSYSIEREFFECFNYRQRPHANGQFKICICKIKANKFDEFQKLYNGKNWISRSGKLNKLKCSIVKIKVTKKESCGAKTNQDDLTTLDENEINGLLEFSKIPQWMPQGNVGTPTSVFIEYINRCIMPQSLIGKLGIDLKNFRKHKKKIYSNVEFKYEESKNSKKSQSSAEYASTASGHKIDQDLDDIQKINEINYQNENAVQTVDEQDEENTDQNEDNDAGNDLEEWERHESLHDDVTKQDRTSPYFFEHEIELQWEKGGSGLVFYTDDNFWKDYENKDFDAETADDLDVDTSTYYDANEGDKDSRDLLEIRRMEMLRNGTPEELFDDAQFIAKHSLNPFKKIKTSESTSTSTSTSTSSASRSIYGRRHLEKLGWKEGEPVGNPSRHGLREPLDGSDGKHPLDRTGLGYHGEKVDRDRLVQLQKIKRQLDHARNPYRIGSKYDTPQTSYNASISETLLRRYEPTIKYRSPQSKQSQN